MELKNIDLFNELDELIANLSEEAIESNEKIAKYVEKTEDIESGNIPESVYSELDNEEYLKELILIAKGL